MNNNSELMEADFETWVRDTLVNHEFQSRDGSKLTLTPLSGDAGFRRYFRVNTREPLLAVYAPPATENSRAFIRISEFLRAQNVRSPLVIANDFARGYLLVEDLGVDLLLPHLNQSDVDTCYSHAMMILLRMQQSALDHSVFPVYDREKLRAEMQLFPVWFVEKKLGLTLGVSDHELIDSTFRILEDSACEQPQVVVHRDFHSRNLLFAEDGNYGVIDFQDAVIGPLTYDLVSLLKDCYIEWPDVKVESWMTAYANMAIEVGILAPVSLETFRRWFVLMGLQRHIKVLGIFCRLSLRDSKHGYLNDLPLVLRYVRKALAQVPELNEFRNWFEQSLMPVISQQSWMREKQTV